MDYNQDRYDYLQARRADGTITDVEVEELKVRAYQSVFNKIEGDPELLAVFRRLRDR